MPEIVLVLVDTIVKLAPGFLALVSGKQSDAEAIEHARACVASLRPLDVHGKAEARRAELARHRATLGRLLSSAALTPAERAAILGALGSADRSEDDTRETPR